MQAHRTSPEEFTQVVAKLRSRRALVKAMASAPLLGVPWLEASCTKQRFAEVLAPPSSLRPALLRQFERETGIQIRPESWVSPIDALGKLLSSSSRADFIVAIADLFAPVIAEAVGHNLVYPLDPTRLPASVDFSEAFRSDIQLVGGQLYSLPLYWGYTSVLYNRLAISSTDPLVDSWGLLFNDRFKGRVALRDDAHESITAAALYMGHKNPLQMDGAEIAEVKNFLVSRKKNFRSLWNNFAEAIQLMATREVDAIYGQPVLTQTLKEQGMNVATNMPHEGLLFFVQAALIPRNAAHPQEAQKWLEFLYRDDIGEKLTEQAGVLSPIERIRQRFSQSTKASFGYEALNAGIPLVRLGRPAHLDLWIEAWAEFKAA
jgi:spermidine/putrescine transport system substrate-binding protein